MTTHGSSFFVGIDVGTGGVRALAVSQSGQLVAQAAVPFDPALIEVAEDRHQQQPRLWWDAVCQATRLLRADLEASGVAAERLAAVSVDGTSGTVVAVDATGRPIRAALMYNDPRAATEAERINEVADSFCRKLGYRFKSSFALAKIAWLRDHEPVTFDRAARFVHQADWIQERLTGRPGISDYSNALKTGYDLVDQRWPDWIDEMLGVTGRLPQVVAPGTPVGSVSAEAARISSLPQGTAVVAGATDGTAACLASGLRRPGDYNTTLGTTLVFKGIGRQICRHPEGLIYCHKLPGDLWLPGAASNTGCEWITRLFPQVKPQAMDAAAAARLPTKYLAYPLVRKGERFPFLSEAAQGFFLPQPEDPADRYAACLEGVAFLERLAYDVLDKVLGTSGGEIFSTGGGSRSDVWMQCRADVTKRIVHRPLCTESAFGTALLAGAGSFPGGLDQAIAEMVHVDKTFCPNPPRAEHYDRRYHLFRDELTKRGYC